jgi:hypothetical protein
VDQLTVTVDKPEIIFGLSIPTPPLLHGSQPSVSLFKWHLESR